MHMSDHLAGSAWSRDDVDYFLDPGRPSWARFDGLTGYVPSDIVIRDGVDGAYTLNSYEDLGPAAAADPSHRPIARRMINYRDQNCRVNTYGDSFTQCHQVSDGETWQEALAAHLGEPIRNFGVGGYGVYQAFCRMRAIELASHGTEFVVLNIFDDDHVRNVDAARWFRISTFRTAMGDGLRPMLHANPWAHLRIDRSTGTFVEHPNLLSTPDSLYSLCDPDFLVDTFGQDPVVVLDCLSRGLDVDDVTPLEELAEVIGHPTDLRSGDVATAAGDLLLAYGLASTLATMAMVRSLIAQRGKRLLVMLSYSSESVIDALEGQPRFDQVLLDDLSVHGDTVADGLAAHVRDFASFSLAPAQYCRRYFNGHYTPTGNQFFAFAVKDALVDWLDPTPIAYRTGDRGLNDSAATLA
ncbi:MAG TPA: hypothetical protein VIM10_00520 [Actinopolymorphaceae bacterium]|jgi:hypothetical protein